MLLRETGWKLPGSCLKAFQFFLWKLPLKGASIYGGEKTEPPPPQTDFSIPLHLKKIKSDTIDSANDGVKKAVIFSSSFFCQKNDRKAFFSSSVLAYNAIKRFIYVSSVKPLRIYAVSGKISTHFFIS